MKTTPGHHRYVSRGRISLNDDHSIVLEVKSEVSPHKPPIKSSLFDYEAVEERPHFPPRPYELEAENRKDPKDILARYFVFVACVLFLIIGRYTVPENDIHCVEDKVMNSLGSMNDFVLAHPYIRDSMQIICSLFMDIMFLITFVHWIYYGKSSRLIITTGMFYLVRAAIQSLFFLPFPTGYWWNHPGIPSLVVPYGRGSDFFFSGHTGFVIICLCEWRKNKNSAMTKFIGIGGIYTMFVLILFRIHYIIDIFAGVIVSHWCFMIVDKHKEIIDDTFTGAYGNVKQEFFRFQRKVQNKEIGRHLLVEVKAYYPEEKELKELEKKPSKTFYI